MKDVRYDLALDANDKGLSFLVTTGSVARKKDTIVHLMKSCVYLPDTSERDQRTREHMSIMNGW